MMPACDRAVAEKLVDYADGALSPADAAAVQDHLAHCAACRNTVAALQRSLEAARIIWHDTARVSEDAGAPVVPSKRRRIVTLAGLGMAAGLVALLTLLWHAAPPDRSVPAKVTTGAQAWTEAEIRLATARAGIAMQMLVAADLLREYPEGTDLACERYRYVASAYADTEAADAAEARLQTVCMERGES